MRVGVTAKNPSPVRRPGAEAGSKSRLRRRRSRAGRVSRPGIKPLDREFKDGLRGALAAHANLKCLGYQLAPALGAPPREHAAAALGGHARTEPVCALAAHLARLIGSLHDRKAPSGDPLARKKRAARLSR